MPIADADFDDIDEEVVQRWGTRSLRNELRPDIVARLRENIALQSVMSQASDGSMVSVALGDLRALLVLAGVGAS